MILSYAMEDGWNRNPNYRVEGGNDTAEPVDGKSSLEAIGGTAVVREVYTLITGVGS